MEKSTSPSQAEVKKPIVSPEMAVKAMNLREQYLSLTKTEQEAVTHFFNLHNNAGWIYNVLMSDQGRKYIDDQVYYSQELAALERVAEEGLDPNEIDITERVNENLMESHHGEDDMQL